LTNVQPEDFSKEHSEINKFFKSSELRKIAKMIRLDLWVEAQNYVDHSVFRINKRNLIQLLVEWRAEPSFEHTPNTSDNDSDSSSDSDTEPESKKSKRSNTSALDEIVENADDNILEERLRDRAPDNVELSTEITPLD